jgi:DNA-binding transcriptional LysR family regulator
METFELRYFLAVAQVENVHRAAVTLAVSPGSLSKAVARLEAELGVPLFQRVGRGIRLTPEGQTLKDRAREILRLEEAARTELMGPRAGLKVRIAGPEVLLAKLGVRLAREVRGVYPDASFTYLATSEPDAERLTRDGEAHVGLTTQTLGSGLTERRLFESVFQTVVGRGHPLFKPAKAGKSLPVATVLQYPFVCPDQAILGRVGEGQSADGWRDDRFPRRIGFVAASLHLIEELVVSGTAVAYLPDYFVEEIPAAALKVSDCPYTCRQTVRLFYRDPEKTSWMSQVFRP